LGGGEEEKKKRSPPVAPKTCPTGGKTAVPKKRRGEKLGIAGRKTGWEKRKGVSYPRGGVFLPPTESLRKKLK